MYKNNFVHFCDVLWLYNSAHTVDLCTMVIDIYLITQIEINDYGCQPFIRSRNVMSGYIAD